MARPLMTGRLSRPRRRQGELLLVLVRRADFAVRQLEDPVREVEIGVVVGNDPGTIRTSVEEAR